MKLDFGDHYNNAEGIWRHDMKGASSSNSQNSNSKALVAKYSQGEIDWTKEFDDDPVTFAMVALNGIEEDDWSIEIDADHVDLGQDGLGVFDWSEEVDNAPVNPEKKEALKEIMLIIDGVALGKREPSRSTCNRFEKPAISTSGGCQYLGRRLVSWQCKKQTIVAISSTEAEYVAAASCCGQVQLFGSQYWNDEPIATFKGRTACKMALTVLIISPKFSGKLTPLTPPMLEVATAVRAEHSLHTEELDITTSSHHSDDSSAGKKAESSSPKDLRLKKQNANKQLKFLSLRQRKNPVKKGTPKIAEYRSFVKINATLSKKKKMKKAHKKKSSSFKQGRKKVFDGSTGLNEVDVNSVLRGANLSTGTSMKEVEDESWSSNLSDQERPESTNSILDPNIKVKGYNVKEEPKKKKLTLQQLRAAETANDEEVARKVAAEWEEEEERKRLAGLERLQAELEDNEMIAAEVQRTERENFTEEQKAKFLVETIAAQRRFRAEQQAALRRSKPPTIPQLRNQMMKYIRNVGGKAYRNLKNKSYEEIKDIYEKVKRVSMTNLLLLGQQKMNKL
ncbi:uncharacterized mitochondrial protein-like protein [Tanacetum coccineum]|uniref:Uncharacterized mitochondrial protein-like protein n=1 Tax=Tanacetum coccineum TaxID=301880 RepID=A0ABQ5GFR6_9ASTR